jgi:hypothetical protein
VRGFSLSSVRRSAAVAAIGALLVGAGTALAPAASAAAPAPIGPALFGLHVMDPQGHFPTVPFGTARLWDSPGTKWKDVNPAPDVWDFSAMDAQVDRLRAAKKDIVIVLGQTPQWASARPQEAGSYGLGAAAEPADMANWRAYVRALAVRYKGKVTKWELWNEPNVLLFFSGTSKTAVSMARDAWTELKAVDRRNTVITGGIAVRTDNSPKWLDAFLKNGGGKYADVIAVHMYVRARQRPENTIVYLAKIRKIMAAGKVGKLPVWNTESSYGRATPDDLKTHEIYTGATAVGYVARTYLLMAAGGVSRSYWYGWDQRGFTGLYLTGADQITATPAGTAYGVTYKWLVGARMLGCTKTTSGAFAGGYTCTLKRGNANVRVLWHPDRSRTVKVPVGFRSMQTLDGSKKAVRSGQAFTVGTAPVLISSAA